MALPLGEPVPVPPRLLDLGAWESLDPVEGARLELVEGVLQVAAAPERVHQRAARKLIERLCAGLSDRWAVEGDIDVIVARDDGRGGPWPTVRRPDVVVFPDHRVLDDGALDAREVLLVAEVLSPGTRRVDRIAKLADYAEAGIEHYLLVDVDPVSLTVFRLGDDGSFRRIAVTTAPEVVTLEVDGAEVVVDLEALIRR